MMGKTIFRNLIVGWYLSEKYGLTIRSIRCAVCEQPIELAAIKVDEDIYLTCPDGHLVGSNVEPGLAKERLIHKSASYHQNSDLVMQYQNLKNEVQEGSKPLADLQKWEFKYLFSNRSHFTKKQDFNNKILDLMKEFKHHFN